MSADFRVLKLLMEEPDECLAPVDIGGVLVKPMFLRVGGICRAVPEFDS